MCGKICLQFLVGACIFAPYLTRSPHMDTAKTNIRLPRELYTDLRTIATANHVTVTEYVREIARPYSYLQNQIRYDGLVTLRDVITERTAVPDTTGVAYLTSGPALTEEYHGLTLWYSEGEYIHRISKYEGEATADVVTDYAGTVWSALNRRFPNDDGRWLEALRDVCTNHRFVIGRVNFAEWQVFDSATELDMWRRFYADDPGEVTLDNVEEYAVWAWATTNLRRIRTEGSQYEGEYDGQLWLNEYSNVSEAAQVEGWARVCVRNLRETGHGAEVLSRYDIRFTPRVVTPPRKKRVPHIKEAEREAELTL